MVYFLQTDHYVKIGFSETPQKRISSIQVSLPTKLRVLMIIKGGRKLEKQLHKRFAHLRSNGEWFKINEEIEDYLAEMEDQDLKWDFGYGDPKKNELMPVRRHRIDCGLTLQDLGDRLGITRQGAHNLEQSANQGTISLNKMRELAEAMDSYFEFRFIKKTKHI